ncbi:MAG: lipopolysaccharide heptosyltransferase II [Desulfobacterales bacterium]|nr:lipopolysaccharide heptosyltransferase II [Desulfobacterales bacterium]
MRKNLTTLNLKKILVRSTNWIGDAIMTTPAVRTIRGNFPKAEITLLALPWVADVFSASPHVDRIFLYEKNGCHQGLRGRRQLIADLRDQGFDLAILLQNAFEAALITFLAGIPNRAGYSTDGRRLFLTHPVVLPKARKKIHQVHYYQGLLADLGLTLGPDDLFLDLSDQDRHWAQGFVAALADRPSGEKRLLIGLNPGAAYGPAKRWPAEKFARLADLVARELDGQLLVFGTAADRQTAAVIVAAAPGHVVDLTGRTSLGQVMALIEQCRVFVTNDSGLMHVAAALATPTAAIFGSTNPVTTGPYSDTSLVIRKEIPCSPCLKTHCRKENFRCMTGISSPEVLEAIKKLLLRTGTEGGS